MELRMRAKLIVTRAPKTGRA